MAQLVRTTAALPEDLGPSTTWPRPLNSSSRACGALLWPLWVLHECGRGEKYTGSQILYAIMLSLDFFDC